jgi:hypothetical protein
MHSDASDSVNIASVFQNIVRSWPQVSRQAIHNSYNRLSCYYCILNGSDRKRA